MPEQLQMTWPAERAGESLQWSVPEGYLLRNFRDGDEEPYVNLMNLAGFSEWNKDNLNAVIEGARPNEIFFIEHVETSEIVATTMGWQKPSKYFSSGVELGWVACSPDHRGKGLGSIVCAAVTNGFLVCGYHQIYLQTDDFRLPAIKTYLKLGYIPVYHLPDMQQRWKTVIKKLNLREVDYPGITVAENKN